jgi:glycosyltransferase involved in cell wall biosynthesis
MKAVSYSMTEIYPYISVILPTYNRAHLLKHSIKSVLNQTYKNFELIVVDDASVDNTEDLVKSIYDKRIKYIKHEINKGANAARNTGIMVARGVYIGFQDSDDEWLPEKLRRQVDVINNISSLDGKVDVVYTSYWKKIGDSCEYAPGVRVSRKEGDVFEPLLSGNFITTQSVLIKRECFDVVGLFDEDLPRLQDWEILLRISKKFEFRHIDEPLVIVDFTEDSISTKLSAYIDSMKIIINKYQEDFNLRPKILACYYFYLACALMSCHKDYEAKTYFFEALKVQPSNLKYRISAACARLGYRFFNLIQAVYNSYYHKHRY